MSINTNIDSGAKMNIADSLASAAGNTVILSRLSQDYKFGDITLDSPIPCFMKFYDLLEGYTMRVEITEEFKYRPELVAQKYYGTTDLWWLVLYMSKLTKHEEFNLPSVKILKPAYLPDLFEIIERSEKEIGIITVLEDRTMQKVR